VSDTVVFIPAWNEEQNLPAVLDDLHRVLPDADVLVVDDGSTDGTADVARAHGADVHSFGENRGLRQAIAAGYAQALERGYAFCGRVDADGQHPAPELARLLALVREDRCDVAVGSRFVSGDGYAAYRYRPSPARRFGSTPSTRRPCRCSPGPSPAARRRSRRWSGSPRRDSASRRCRSTWPSARAESRSSAAARR
jgi:glycosyltransferase involved in cell wall biosynthesis